MREISKNANKAHANISAAADFDGMGWGKRARDLDGMGWGKRAALDLDGMGWGKSYF
jgi:hypothetical protein